jgi:hypothetical protein
MSTWPSKRRCGESVQNRTRLEFVALARASTKRLDRPDITEAAIANYIMALVQDGARNVDQLYDQTLATLGATPPRV